ncbi:UvrD-helicase domain-containing protein [Actinospongicola halichondriae]|uniref:UvrD-helicase domain-containing protein n=1 Tax=Actinospongicola halichondriae TaxID=3236844 RepID=UPI003D51830A
MSRLPADAPARERIVTDLDNTLFVEAGAGSGKTSSLVGRFVSLVLAGADVAGIAAITFTEAAAAELRARVRETLEDVIAGREVLGLDPDDRGRERARVALDQLDRAAISTLHAFAQRLLLASPIEAGLPPRVEVHDEISSSLRTEDRWGVFVRGLVDDDDLAVPLAAALALDIRMDHLAAVAATCNQNWDLLVDLDLTAERSLMLDEESLLVSVEPIVQAALEIESLAVVCDDETDLLKRWIGDSMWPALEPLRAAAGDPYALLQATADPPKITRNGKAANWPDGTKARIGALWNDARDALTQHRAAIADQVVRRLSVEVVDFTLREAAGRRREGRLEFHDLLVLARQVLRDDRVVRERMHERYRYLLIDEFQDTDPIQVELAVRIAADPGHDTTCPWEDVPVDPGRLFFVGDPKQSIYRFRRADIDLFVRTSERNPSGATRLDTNFRTVAPIVEFCNRVFGTIISRTVVGGDGDGGEIAQPDYADLSPWRDPIAGDPGPPVLLVGHAEKESRAETLRVAEATDIAAALVEARNDGWLVHPKGGEPRPCQWGDMTILLPSRTSLPHLRRALGDAGVPYRLETGSLVYATSEVRELLSVLRSIDDPGDEVALLGALRSRAYGCGDDDLLAWKRAGRSWTYLGQGDDDESVGPVAAAMHDLRTRHRARPFQTVPEVVAAVVRERRLFESAMAVAGHRDAWRLYRVVVEHARQFADGESGGLREFLRWAALQADDKLRSTSPVLPEADVDAVRIMTVHGAKGLEFAITAVSGLSGGFPRSTRGATVRFRPEGGFDVRMKQGLETAQFDARRTVEDVMGEHEGIRLLYVALTRARDHLIVSLHHKAAKNVGCHAHRITEVLDEIAEDDALPDGVERRDGTSSHTADHADDTARPLEKVRPVGADVSPAAVDAWEEDTARWVDARQRLVERAASGGSLSATALRRLLRPSSIDDEGEQPEPTTEPWRRGRAGTSIGSAVHAVLQHADLRDASGADIASLAAWQAQVEGVGGAASEIEAKSRAALVSPLVRRAVGGRWWREVHVGVPVASIVDVSTTGPVDLFEGFIDLLFETDAGLVVVDYKTDTVTDDAAVATALDRYTPQGAAYAVAVEAATGRPVTEAHFLFLRGADAVDAVVDDLDAAKAQVRDALRTYGATGGAATGGVDS